MKSKLIAILLFNVLVNVCLAQEQKKDIHRTDTVPTGQQFREPLVAPTYMDVAPVTDFYASYSLEKKLKINPDAVKINLRGPSYLVKWDGGGITGIGGGRGMYQGRYAGFDFGGTKGGLQLGVQRAYNPYTGQWEMMPMAAPYVNIGGRKVGFDVGGMLYSILRETAIRNSNNHYGDNRSGIIAPPIDWKVGFDGAPEIPAWMEKQFENQ